MIVINCDQFRKNHVLDQFVELLYMYNFVVTQDEDYLNLICRNKVFWLPEKWNAQLFGTLPCEERDICILHYSMVSKPWHYSDCRMQGVFLGICSRKTPVYEQDPGRFLAAYTDEERAEDAASGVTA